MFKATSMFICTKKFLKYIMDGNTYKIRKIKDKDQEKGIRLNVFYKLSNI